MSKKAFIFVSIIQLIGAFVIFLFVWEPELWIFKYRYPFPDPSLMTYYQVDEDALLFIIIFGFPLAISLVLLSVMLIFFFKTVSFRESVLARLSLLLVGIELSIWIHGLIAIIQLSNSLVNCDNLIVIFNMPLWRLFYHLVWATQERQPLISTAHEQILYPYIKGKADFLECQLHAIGGIEDHIHLIVSIPPKLSIANFAKRIKGSSARYLNQELAEDN
jgi:Transposase IS200 like